MRSFRVGRKALWEWEKHLQSHELGKNLAWENGFEGCKTRIIRCYYGSPVVRLGWQQQRFRAVRLQMYIRDGTNISCSWVGHKKLRNNLSAFWLESLEGWWHHWVGEQVWGEKLRLQFWMCKVCKISKDRQLYTCVWTLRSALIAQKKYRWEPLAYVQYYGWIHGRGCDSLRGMYLGWGLLWGLKISIYLKNLPILLDLPNSSLD